MRITVSPPAQQDLMEIRRYIAQRNAVAADQTIKRIRDRFKLLRRHPGAGQACEWISPSIRCFPVGRYVIFYRVELEIVIVLRILHAAQDASALF